jgi:hypothetical protein
MAFECEQLSNATSTFLTDTVSLVDTTVTVSSFNGFPSSAPYRIDIDNETMLVTAGAGTTVWSVVRGQEETVPAIHGIGATVINIFSTNSFKAIEECAFACDDRVNLPAPEVTGRVFLTNTPGWYWYQDQGTSWLSWGPTFDLWEPDLTEFLDYYGDPIALSSKDGGIHLSMNPTPSGESIQGITQVVNNGVTPTAAPYTITTAFWPLLQPTDVTSCGLIFVESSTGKCIFFRLMHNSSASITRRETVISIDKFATATSVPSNYLTLSAGTLFGALKWFRMRDDGTNLSWGISCDGRNFDTIYTASRTDFLATGPDTVGFACHANTAGARCDMTLLSWTMIAG